MKKEILSAIIIGIAIIIAAVLHAFIVRDAGRYQLGDVRMRIDTRTGETFEVDGKTQLPQLQ